MEKLTKKYSRIKDLLSDISTNIDTLSNEELFFDTINIIKKEIEEVKFLKKELEPLTGETLAKNSYGDLDFYTKQILDKFDNIIRTKKCELSEVQLKLIHMQNSKKLIKYKRD